jgi:hypothetical protein
MLAICIVAYKIPFFQSPAYLSIRQSLLAAGLPQEVIYIYDNTDLPDWEVSYNHLPEKQFVSYIHDPTNPGISKAYNNLASTTRKASYTWILFFDQDTEVPVSLITKYLEAIAARPEPVLKAPTLKTQNGLSVSPCNMRYGVASPLAHLEPGVHSLKGKSLLNSGLACSLDLFFKAGGYNEAIMLDFSDHDFIDRARRLTDRFELIDVVCLHGFSDQTAGLESAIARYKIFRHDLAAATRRSWIDMLGFQYVAFKRLVGLTIRYRSFAFLKARLGQRFKRL